MSQTWTERGGQRLAWAQEPQAPAVDRNTRPPTLVKKLERLMAAEDGLDPRTAYRLCQQHPSPLASALRAAKVKVGRPHAELEKAVEDAGAREAAALANHLRPLSRCPSDARPTRTFRSPSGWPSRDSP
jgi:hypothetical protein